LEVVCFHSNRSVTDYAGNTAWDLFANIREKSTMYWHDECVSIGHTLDPGGRMNAREMYDEDDDDDDE